MPPSSGESSDSSSRRNLRLWPAFLITLSGFARCLQIWVFRDYDIQFKVQGTADLLRYWALAMLFWWLFFSRIRWRSRCLGLLIALAASGVFFLLVRVQGIDGNRVPILKWRWALRSDSNRQSSQMGAIDPTHARSYAANGSVVSSAPFPQFLGPGRNGVLPGPALFGDWNARPPVRLWLEPVGEGWSGFAVEGADAVSLEQQGADEVVVCRELATGSIRWKCSYPARYEDPSAGTGPRTVPLLGADRVWTTGATGVLTCMDRREGKVLWQHNCLRDADAPIPEWGFSGSPLLVGRWVVVSPGGNAGKAVVAYDQRSGEIAWSSGNDVTGYSSPVLVTLGRTAQVLSFGHTGVSGFSALDGRLLWWRPTARIPNVAIPLVVDDRHVLISAGYGYGAELLEISQQSPGNWQSTQVWRTTRMKSKFANLILHEGYVYGFDDGMFACLKLSDGSRAWKDGRYGHGQVLKVGGQLLVTTEFGEIVLITPSAEGLKERARYRVLDGKTWNPPALAGDILLVRHDRFAACFRLPIE